MNQQSYYWAYTQRKLEFNKTQVRQCSLQQYLQYSGHGSNLNVHKQERIKMWCIYIMGYHSAIKGTKLGHL